MKKLAHESILEQMKNKIAAGVWKPGERLPTLQSLTKEFGLSISSVREALRILESQRIVSIEHGRGMFIRNDPSLFDDSGTKIREMENSSLIHLLEARLILEPELAALCAERATFHLTKQLRQMAEEMIEERARGGNFFSTDLLFHQTIADGADNPVLAQMLSAISDLSAAGRRQTNKLPNASVKAANFHMLIALAIEERQPEQSRLLMKSHIDDMILAIKNQPANFIN